MTLTDQKKVKDRWLEHFQELYKASSQTDVSVLQEIPTHQLVVDTTLSILRAEVEAAIRRLKTKKSPGLDNITADEIQATGDRGVDVLFALCK